MCWSLEVSVATGILVYINAFYLWSRNMTERDRWNAIFLVVFGSMQWIDVMLWSLSATEDLRTCSKTNGLITFIGFSIIMFEPFASLLARCYAKKEKPTKNELFIYIFCFIILPILGKHYFSYGSGCSNYYEINSGKGMCTQLSPNGYLRLGIGQNLDGINNCWAKNYFYGEFTAEIPLLLRLLFLIGMSYPYLSSNPYGSGLLQIGILTLTWLIGYFSDSHASIWCLANVGQIITMILDPFIFSHQEKQTYTRNKKKPYTRNNKCNKVRYNRDKIPENIDAIIIGSGIGSLTTASLLSKMGKKVLVLEQHDTAGGCTHTFEENNNLFDSGIHYVGAVNMLDRMLSYITNNRVKFALMGSEDDGYLYDIFDIGSMQVKYRKGKENLMKELITKFPHEKSGIEQYMKTLEDVSKTAKYFALLKILPHKLFYYLFYLYERITGNMEITADQKIKQYISDPRLIAILSGGQLIDWNLQPDKTSWFVVASMMNYYLDGGYYPEGGSHRIAEEIIPCIERSGGRVLCRVRVEKITFNEKKEADGVELEDGTNITAPIIISNAGALNTYQTLVSEEIMQHYNLNPKFDFEHKINQSNGHITAFISLDGDSKSFDLRPANIHSMPGIQEFNNNINTLQETFYLKSHAQKDCLMTITCPSAKDPHYDLKYPNKANVLMLTEAKYEWLNGIDPGFHNNRSDEYELFKKKFEPIFLERLYQYYPKTKGHINHISIGSPLTTEHYISAPQGASYGLEWTPQHFNKELQEKYLQPKTKIKNLYLTGEASFFGGLCGAMFSGWITTYHILGWKEMILLLLTTYRT